MTENQFADHIKYPEPFSEQHEVVLALVFSPVMEPCAK